MLRYVILCFALSITTTFAVGAEPTIGDLRIRQLFDAQPSELIEVWPSGTGPDETLGPSDETVVKKSRGGTAWNITRVTRPTLTLVRPPEGKANGMTVIVCPGGGYGGLAIEHEGTRICQWLNKQGITAALLKYRVPRRGGEYAKHHHALQDIQRSVRLLRANADKLGIDSTKLGICGFSAGGHLCTVLATNFETDSYAKIDTLDEQSSRPDFVILTYPAYLTDPIQSDDVDPNTLNLNATTTPPIFMSIAMNDRFARGMINYSLKLLEAKVSTECHIYPSGGHGGGLEPSSYPNSEWIVACERWLKDVDSKLTAK